MFFSLLMYYKISMLKSFVAELLPIRQCLYGPVWSPPSPNTVKYIGKTLMNHVYFTTEQWPPLWNDHPGGCFREVLLYFIFKLQPRNSCMSVKYCTISACWLADVPTGSVFGLLSSVFFWVHCKQQNKTYKHLFSGRELFPAVPHSWHINDLVEDHCNPIYKALELQ